MKRFIYLYIILLGITIPAQMKENRFEQVEYDQAASLPGSEFKENEPPPDTQPGWPGQPGDPSPIDDYLPLLVVAALGIIVLKLRSKTSAS